MGVLSSKVRNNMPSSSLILLSSDRPQMSSKIQENTLSKLSFENILEL